MGRSVAAPDVLGSRLDAIARASPESRGWLALLEETLRETGGGSWDSVGVSVAAGRSDGSPLLDGATLAVDAGRVSRWIRTLLETAARWAGVRGAWIISAADRLDATDYLEAALCQDLDRVRQLAVGAAVEPDALLPWVGLAGTPLLQACRRQLDRQVPRVWPHGSCPLCGGWPALAEIRGLERERRLRCARCGADWWIDWLRCPFCWENGHDRLGALVPESHGETRRVETCSTCRGYLKTLTTLTPWPPEGVMLEDLATTDLDVSALAHEFVRPARAASLLALRLSPTVASSPRRATRLRARLWRR